MYPLVFIPANPDENTVNGDGIDGNAKVEDKTREETMIHPNDIVITGSSDACAKIWSLQSGECLHVSS